MNIVLKRFSYLHSTKLRKTLIMDLKQSLLGYQLFGQKGHQNINLQITLKNVR